MAELQASILESIIRGHHIYKQIWLLLVGEILTLKFCSTLYIVAGHGLYMQFTLGLVCKTSTNSRPFQDGTLIGHSCFMVPLCSLCVQTYRKFFTWNSGFQPNMGFSSYVSKWFKVQSTINGLCNAWWELFWIASVLCCTWSFSGKQKRVVTF